MTTSKSDLNGQFKGLSLDDGGDDEAEQADPESLSDAGSTTTPPMAKKTDGGVILETVPHVKQSYHWDCGIACVKMVLGYFGRKLNDLDRVCADLDFKESVWTIDLAYILEHYGVKCQMYTVTLGVDPGYSKERYYTKLFTVDECRVTELFNGATRRGVRVDKRSVRIKEIVDHLSQRDLVILLIDWSHMSCVWCDAHSCGLCGIKSCHRCTGTYQGHFIVLCGYDKSKGLVFYRDPSMSKRICACRYSTLNNARLQYGTDEDIIFIYK
ncbi:protein GUCD1-like [Tubulanus polymorphus]|uniref:protein GUCD1-like n=1 Tax=Tubulanus polymorphus TaxID=672921 RepID=UPI003DA69F44